MTMHLETYLATFGCIQKVFQSLQCVLSLFHTIVRLGEYISHVCAIGSIEWNNNRVEETVEHDNEQPCDGVEIRPFPKEEIMDNKQGHEEETKDENAFQFRFDPQCVLGNPQNISKAKGKKYLEER